MADHPLPYPGIDRLITALRNLSVQVYQLGGPTCDTIGMAADEIERLRKENESLRGSISDVISIRAEGGGGGVNHYGIKYTNVKYGEEEK